MAVSPLAPKGGFPDLPQVAGVEIATAAAAIRYRGRDDLMLARLVPGSSVAGVFTRSATRAAPVIDCQAKLGGPDGDGAAILVNAGNANAFTGAAGEATVEATAEEAARLVGGTPDQVLLCSTGVIGEPLAADAIASRLGLAMDALAPDGWADASEAIRTTDTFAKRATRTARIGGTTVTLNGFAKGSGMIAPDMATMLAFLFTDAAIPAPILHRLLTRAVDRTFNATTVDGDTSTSDTVLLAATGAAGNPLPEGAGDRSLSGFKRALEDLCRDLAQQIVRDGEGASKFIEIAVTGATSARAARRIGLAIANSPLVKTAIAGEDANWGRIVMAVGKAGEQADRDRLTIAVGGVEIARRGDRVVGYDEAPVAAHMKGRDISIAVDLGLGRGRATVWTCDLTHGYISINADYRS